MKITLLIAMAFAPAYAYADSVDFAFQPGGSLTGNLLTGVTVSGVNATASRTSPTPVIGPIPAGTVSKSTGIASTNTVVPNIVAFAYYLPGSPLTVGGSAAPAVSSTLQFLSALPLAGVPATRTGTFILTVNTPTAILDPALAAALGVQVSATGVSATLTFSGTYNFATGAVNGTATTGHWTLNAAPASSVPEPQTSFLMGLGIATGALIARRQRLVRAASEKRSEV
jgi:hypothetical protein